MLVTSSETQTQAWNGNPKNLGETQFLGLVFRKETQFLCVISSSGCDPLHPRKKKMKQCVFTKPYNLCVIAK